LIQNALLRFALRFLCLLKRKIKINSINFPLISLICAEYCSINVG
jgi:hypothetical protein